MPALSSSLIGPALERFSDLPAGDRAVLAGCLPRDRRGVRHSLASLFMTAVAAVLAGATSFTAVSEWVADAPARGRTSCSPSSRHHAVFTDSPFEIIQAEERHRGHAQVEQVFADLADVAPAHLPSGAFPPNAARLACAAMAHNLLRAAGSRPASPAPRPGPPRCAATSRRRRPDRPPRPRPDHPAPARRLAPPDRMDEPFRSRLRAAAAAA